MVFLQTWKSGIVKKIKRKKESNFIVLAYIADVSVSTNPSYICEHCLCHTVYKGVCLTLLYRKVVYSTGSFYSEICPGFFSRKSKNRNAIGKPNTPCL